MKLPAFPVFGIVARFYGDTFGSCRVCERSNWGTEEKHLLCGWSRVESDIPPNLRGWAPPFVPGDVFTARWGKVFWLVGCSLVAGGGGSFLSCWFPNPLGTLGVRPERGLVGLAG